MIDLIAKANSFLNNLVWGVPAIALILSVGILLSIKMRFFQITKLGFTLKNTIGKVFSKTQAKEGSITPFQALCTALSATLGTGSIAGVAGAIALGGPGAVFWMWVSAFFGMCTKFTEVTLSLRYREVNSKGDYVGGPMYFIKNGLGKKWMPLAYIFCISAILAVMGTGNATQTNTVIVSLSSSLQAIGILSAESPETFNLISGIVLTIIVGFVLMGGIKRLGKVTESLVPAMSVLFITLAIGVVIIKAKYIPLAFKSIIQGAFDPSAITGGAIGSVFISLRRGISRGIFSNEAGLGTASIAHAESSETSPVKQGLFGVFEVFITTMVICTLTALVIICGNNGVIEYGVAAGAELTIRGFESAYGSWATVFVSLAIICFAFSTILGWGLYGQRCIEFIFGEKACMPFIIVYSLVCIVGATMNLGLIWEISETFNGMMAIPNLIAVALLSSKATQMKNEFFADKGKHILLPRAALYPGQQPLH